MTAYTFSFVFSFSLRGFISPIILKRKKCKTTLVIFLVLKAKKSTILHMREEGIFLGFGQSLSTIFSTLETNVPILNGLF